MAFCGAPQPSRGTFAADDLRIDDGGTISGFGTMASQAVVGGLVTVDGVVSVDHGTLLMDGAVAGGGGFTVGAQGIVEFQAADPG